MPPVVNVPQNASQNFRYSATDLLNIKREEIRGQLKEIAQRRNSLQEQRQVASSPAVAKDLDARMAVMDARSAKLEADLFATNDQITRGLSDAAPNVQSTTQDSRDAARTDAQNAARNAARNASRGAGISIASILAVLIVWRAIKSFFPRNRASASLPDTSPQLVQLQQSLDAIAVEVERISEAQRYQAKLMNERGIGPGDAQPVAAPNREQVGARPGRL